MPELQNLGAFLPITVFFAVGIFFIKEIIEFFRRKGQKKRKISALKLILAHELETLYTAFKQIFSAVEAINECSTKYPATDFKIEFSYGNKERFSYSGKNGDGTGVSSCGPLEEVRFDNLDGLLIQAAELDKKLYESLASLHKSIPEINNIRYLLVDQLVSNKPIMPEGVFPEHYCEYALRQREKIYSAMNHLYFLCTSNDLTVNDDEQT